MNVPLVHKAALGLSLVLVSGATLGCGDDDGVNGPPDASAAIIAAAGTGNSAADDFFRDNQSLQNLRELSESMTAVTSSGAILTRGPRVELSRRFGTSGSAAEGALASAASAIPAGARGQLCIWNLDSNGWTIDDQEREFDVDQIGFVIYVSSEGQPTSSLEEIGQSVITNAEGTDDVRVTLDSDDGSDPSLDYMVDGPIGSLTQSGSFEAVDGAGPLDFSGSETTTSSSGTVTISSSVDGFSLDITRVLDFSTESETFTLDVSTADVSVVFTAIFDPNENLTSSDVVVTGAGLEGESVGTLSSSGEIIAFVPASGNGLTSEANTAMDGLLDAAVDFADSLFDLFELGADVPPRAQG